MMGNMFIVLCLAQMVIDAVSLVCFFDLRERVSHVHLRVDAEYGAVRVVPAGGRQKPCVASYVDAGLFVDVPSETQVSARVPVFAQGVVCIDSVLRGSGQIVFVVSGSGRAVPVVIVSDSPPQLHVFGSHAYS